MNKLAKFACKPAVKKIFGIFFSALMIFSMAIPSFATDATTPSDYSDDAVAGMKTALGHVTATLSISTILKVIAAGLGVAVSFFLLWWGIRKLIKMVRQGFSKGKVSV